MPTGEWVAMTWVERLARLKSAESADGADGADGAERKNAGSLVHLKACRDFPVTVPGRGAQQ